MANQYFESLLEREDILVNQIETCDHAIQVVIDMLCQKNGPIDLQSVRDILSAMHEVRVKKDRDLLLLNVEKKLVSKHHEQMNL